MNTITPQQLGDHANLHRRDVADDFSANRARRAARGGVTRGNRRRRSASMLATGAFGAAAFLAGGLLHSDAVTARPPAAQRPVAEVTVATPDCVAQPGPTERPVNLHPQARRVPRNVRIAV